MAWDRGRIVIVSDLRPKELLDICEQIAVDSDCAIDDLRTERVKGFHICDARGEAPIYTLGTLIASSAGMLRVPMDIDIYADRTKRGDGRISIDWIETGSSLRQSVCRFFAESFADELETRIEQDGGEVFDSYDD